MRKLKLDLDALTVTSFEAESAPVHVAGTVDARMAETTACPETMAKSCPDNTQCGFDTRCCEYTWHLSCLPNNPCDTLHCLDTTTGGEEITP